MRVPDLLAHTAEAWFGDEGRLWLENLPALVAECEQRWAIVVGEPFEPGGAVSWVAPAEGRGGAHWVLKLSFPDEESKYENVALRQIHGEGAVRLIDAYRDRRALLLERLEPGTPLSELEVEDEAMGIAAGLLGRLWRPLQVGHPFARADDEALHRAQEMPIDLAATHRPCSRTLVAEAVELAYHLAATQSGLVLANRDFRLGNILAARREPWLAIAPKPIAAEREYGCGALLRDWPAEIASDSGAAGRVAHRLDLLSDLLELDRERLRDWGMLQAVALGLWSHSVGDHDAGDLQLACAAWLQAA